MKLFNQFAKVFVISLLCIAIIGCHQDPITEPVKKSDNLEISETHQNNAYYRINQHLIDNPVIGKSARSASGTFAFFVGFDPDAVFAMASQNGHTIELLGEGVFNAHPKEILAGEGTFVHRDENGEEVFTGTWIAEKLLSFQNYGPATVDCTGALGFDCPPDWRAGYANILVNLVEPGLDAILRVYCLLPGVKPSHNAPVSTPEGALLSVKGGLNFNKIVELAPGFGGPTLFVDL